VGVETPFSKSQQTIADEPTVRQQESYKGAEKKQTVREGRGKRPRAEWREPATWGSTGQGGGTVGKGTLIRGGGRAENLRSDIKALLGRGGKVKPEGRERIRTATTSMGKKRGGSW